MNGALQTLDAISGHLCDTIAHKNKGCGVDSSSDNSSGACTSPEVIRRRRLWTIGSWDHQIFVFPFSASGPAPSADPDLFSPPGGMTESTKPGGWSTFPWRPAQTCSIPPTPIRVAPLNACATHRGTRVAHAPHSHRRRVAASAAHGLHRIAPARGELPAPEPRSRPPGIRI
jgi:hypothetical protein